MSAVVKALVSARQKCLTDDEAYWDPRPDFTQPVSARNEAAALSWLLDHQAVVCRGGPDDVAELRALCADYCARLGVPEPPEQRRQQQLGVDREPGDAEAEASTSGRSFEEASAEAALQRWCQQRGVKGAASPALFGVAAAPAAVSSHASNGSADSAGGGRGEQPGDPLPLRGLRADSEVAPGDLVLQVPADLLISYETAKDSDLGKVLSALPLGLGDDSIALIWTCVERREPESTHAPFWAALPERFATVLSASDADVALLEGTPLHGEAVQARKHLREAFESTSPAFRSLLQAYPDYFKPDWFSWEAYLWAAELWYSYGIQVQFAGGDIRTCLAPYLGLMNHHPLPHVVHFSKVDPKTGCLRVRAFRPCDAGRQLFLSYGPYPNGKLLLFYGFALPDNPADEVELTLQVPSGPSATDRRALLAAAGLTLDQRLRAGCRLPPPLLACARLLAAPLVQLQEMRSLPPAELKARLAAPAAPVVESAALGLIEGAIETLLRPAVEREQRLRSVARGSHTAAPGGSSEAAVAEGEVAKGGAEAKVGPTVGAGIECFTHSDEELRHFAAVYVAGMVRILKESLAAVRAAAPREPGTGGCPAAEDEDKS